VLETALFPQWVPASELAQSKRGGMFARQLSSGIE